MNETPSLFPGFDIECKHPRTTITLTPHVIHYAREDCLICKKFLRWVPKPENPLKPNNANE